MKSRVFKGSQTKTLLKDQHFLTPMVTIDIRYCNAFADVIHNFFGNKVKLPNESILLKLILEKKDFC